MRQWSKFSWKNYTAQQQPDWPDNKHYKRILIKKDMDFQIWGVVTHSIHHF